MRKFVKSCSIFFPLFFILHPYNSIVHCYGTEFAVGKSMVRQGITIAAGESMPQQGITIAAGESMSHQGITIAAGESMLHQGIIIAAGANSPPIYFLNENKEPAGWLVDIWRLWSHNTGIPITFKMRSFGESLKLMKTGGAHVHAGCLYGKKRTKYLDYLMPLIDIETHIFINENIYGINSLADLQGFKVGVIAGDYAVDYLRNTMPEISLDIYKNNHQLFNAAEKGHVKVFVKDKPIALHKLKKKGLIYNFKYDAVAPLYKNKFYAAVPKGRGEARIARLIQEGMAEISLREFTEIEQKWTGGLSKRTENVFVISMPRFYEPFSMLSHDGRPAGLMVELWQLWSQKTGYGVSFKFGRWQETLRDLKDGVSDIHCGLFKNPQREQWIEFSHPLLPVASQLYFSTDVPTVSLKQLQERKVGVLQETYQESWLKENHPDTVPVLFSNTIEMLNALINKKIHAMLDESVKVEAAVNHLKLAGYVHHAPEFTLMNDLCAAVLKENRELYQIMVDGLSQISKQELIELENHWILNPRLKLLSLGFHKFELTAQEKAWLKEHRTFRLGVDPEWAPVEYLDSDETYSGISSDYIRHINKKLNITMSVVKGLEWSETLHETKKGNIDILPCVTKTPERSAYINFTRPYISFPIVLVTRDDAPFISSIKDLSEGTIAVVRSYATHENIVRDYPSQKLLVMNSLEKGLLAVENRNADAFMGNLVSISYAMKKLGMTGLNIAADTEYLSELSIGISKDLSQLLPILNKTLDSIDEKTKNDILNRWSNVRFEYRVSWKQVRKIAIVATVFTGSILGVILLWNRRLAREMAEHKLTQLRFHSMAAHVPGAIFQAEITHEYQLLFNYLSPRCHEFFDFIPHDVMQDSKILSIHKDDNAAFTTSLLEAVNGNRDWNFTGRLTSLSMGTKWFEGMGKAIRNEPKEGWIKKEEGTEGRRLKEQNFLMNGILIDITERKLAELKYMETEKRIRAMSQTSSDGMIMIDAKGIVQFWNLASESFFNISAFHAVGKSLGGLITLQDDSGQDCRELFQVHENFEAGSEKFFELAAGSESADVLPIELSRTTFSVEGRRYGLMTLRDISKRKKNELELKKLSRAIEHSPASVIITDTHGTIEYVNPAFVSITGYSADEAIGETPKILSSGRHSVDFFKRIWDIIMSGRVWEGEVINRRKNGEEFWEKTFIAPITNDEGDITHFVAVKNDITETKKNELLLHQQLRELERFNSLTIDREIKMIDLKKEINQLMFTLGRKEKYKIVK